MRRIALCLLVVISSALHGFAEQSPDTTAAGTLVLLELTGDGLQDGVVHGQRLKTQIQSAIESMQRTLTASGQRREQTNAARVALEESLPASTRAMLTGIAQGAEVAEESVLQWNAYWLTEPTEGVQAVCFGERTIGGRLHHAIGVPPGPHGQQFVFNAHKAGKTHYLTVNTPGIVLPLAGLNQAGISVSMHPDVSASAKDRVTASLNLEQVLERETSLAGAVSPFQPLSGVAFLISDGKAPDARLVQAGKVVGPNEESTGKDALTDGASNASILDSETSSIGASELAARLQRSGRIGVIFSASEITARAIGNGPLQQASLVSHGEVLRWEMTPGDTAASLVKGTVQPPPRKADAQLPEIYRLEPKAFSYEIEPESTFAGILRSRVRFPSPVETEFPENNTIHGELFRPFGPGPFPCVIVLHIAGGDFELSRFVARMLTRGNVAALFVKMPYYGERRPKTGRIRMVSSDLERGLTSMRQVVLDLRRTCDWIEHAPDLDGNRIGVAGISLGSITGSLAAAIESRITHACLIMGGARLEHVLYESSEREALEYRQMWTAAGGDRESFAKVFAPYDPATYGDRLCQRVVLMISASEDKVIPMQSTLALWEATGRQEIIWYPCGHYTMVKYFLPALSHAVKFFQDWPTQPLRPEVPQAPLPAE